MAKITSERTGEYLKEALLVLKEKGSEYPSSDLINEMASRLALTDYEKSLNNSGQQRWITNFRFYSIGLVKAGWIEKTGRTWKLTDAANNFATLAPSEIFNVAVDAYDSWDSGRTKNAKVGEEIIEQNDDPEVLMQVKPDDITFQDLITGISSGRIQIPPFQRSFVWRATDIRYLLDSIYRGYPIGSFIFWKTTRKLPRTRTIGNIALEGQEISPGTEIAYVLDGQQRITSLFAAVKGADIDGGRYRFLFDLRSKKFTVSQVGHESADDLLRNDREKLQISIESVITNSLAAYRQLCRQYGENEEYAKTLDTLYDRFVNYRFSVIQVIDQTPKTDEDRSEGVRQVVRMFSRINETGHKLTVVAKMVARCWGEGFDLREELDAFYSRKELETIREETLLQAASVILNYRKSRSRDILENTNIRKLESEWDSIVKAFLLAVEFVKTKIRIKNLDYLPFDVILVPLAYLFAKQPVLTHEQAGMVEQWFWRACLSNRYDATVEARSEEDCVAFDRMLNGEKPEFAFLIDWDTLKTRLIAQRYNLRNAFVKTVLALYSYAEPKDLVDGRGVSLENAFTGYYKHNLHHIFPQAYLRDNKPEQREFFDSVANIMFIPAITNIGICDAAPSAYVAELRRGNADVQEIFAHHYIPDMEKSGLLKDDFLGFLDYRAEQLVQAFRFRTGIASRSEEQLMHDPTKPIDILEAHIRSFLHRVFKEQTEGAYWSEFIPADVQDTVNRKIQQELTRHPYSLEEYEREDVRMEFLDVTDYPKIINANWPLLHDYFGSKWEVERHFLALKNFRNAIKHGRSLNEVDRKNGEAAVLWLGNVVK